MWKEFCAMNPHSPPAETVEKTKPKRTAKKDKKVAPLRIKLPKKKKKYESDEDDLPPEDDDDDYVEGKYETSTSRSAPKRTSARRNRDDELKMKEPDEDEFSELMEMKPSGPIEHNEQCGFCKDTGELLVCETCPRVYHLKSGFEILGLHNFNGPIKMHTLMI